jgi:hypothetical protein
MLKLVLPYLVPFLVIAMIAWRASRSMKGRVVDPSRLWVRPAIIVLVMLAMLANSPMPASYAFMLFAVAALVGAGMGYLMTRHQEFSIDAATGVVTSRTSPIGVMLFAGLFLGRYLLKLAVTGGQAPDRVVAHSAQYILYTDVGLFFVVALVAAQAWETWRRIKPLTAAHAARQPAE